jgi:hypothetical protein
MLIDNRLLMRNDHEISGLSKISFNHSRENLRCFARQVIIFQRDMFAESNRPEITQFSLFTVGIVAVSDNLDKLEQGER